MAPTHTPTLHTSLSVNTVSLLLILEFSLPSIQERRVSEDVDVIIPELQPFAIEQ